MMDTLSRVSINESVTYMTRETIQTKLTKQFTFTYCNSLILNVVLLSSFCACADKYGRYRYHGNQICLHFEYLPRFWKMPALSKTGLIPSVQKKIKYDIQPRTTFEVSDIAVPAPYVLRPFAGIYNPFPYGCSVLCNHPADLEAKNVVKKAKDTWAIEGRTLSTTDDLKVIKCQKYPKFRAKGIDEIGDLGSAVPEELFRRYTETDSRPVTPAPTVTSLATKHSQLLRRRRCMTPDPVPSCLNKKKMMLVLDLRRSHSQETINWIRSQHGELTTKPQASAPSRASSTSRGTTISSKKKSTSKTLSVTPRSVKSESQRDEKSIQSFKQPFNGKSLLAPEANKTQALSGASSDNDLVKRRGKRKKGKKLGKDKDKEFQGLSEPGETQVSALDNESRLGSTRPSLTAATGLLDVTETERLVSGEETGKRQSESFLDKSILKQLQRQLDHESVESELNVKKRIALEEALRLIPKLKPSKQNQEIKYLKKEFASSWRNPEKWMALPRVFTRQRARFELPMDSRILNDLSPLKYAERYVFPSEERLVLYNQVFNLHMEEFDEDEDEYVDRILLGKNVASALGDIMGREMSEKEAMEFRDLMGWTDDMTIYFRMFTGISAICERLSAREFYPKMPKPGEDLKHEVERADFESLDRKLQFVKADERMIRILRGIRDL